MDIIEIIKAIVQNPFFLKYGLVGLFLNGLFSSVIPIPTELTTTALLSGGESPQSVFIVLAASSIIGGFLAYYLGRTGNKFFKHFYKKPDLKNENKGHGMLVKYGWIAIFFCSWIPVLGDVIPIVAGAKKYDFRKFAIAMSTGKAVKVLAIVYVSGLLTNFLH